VLPDIDDLYPERKKAKLANEQVPTEADDSELPTIPLIPDPAMAVHKERERQRRLREAVSS